MSARMWHDKTSKKLTHDSENPPDFVFNFEDMDPTSGCQNTLPHHSEESSLRGHRRENLVSQAHHSASTPFAHLMKNTWAGYYTVSVFSLIRCCSL
jgi:hypothetical protein